MLVLDNRGHQYQVANEYEEIDLRELILDIWASKWTIIIITLAFILAAAIYSFFIVDPVYQASTTVELSNVEGLYSKPANIVRYLKSNTLLLPVMRDLGYDYSEAGLQRFIASSLTVESSSNSSIIDISLRNHDPQLVGEVLKGIVAALKEEADRDYELKTEKLKRDISNIERELEEIGERIAGINREIELIIGSGMEPAEKSILTTSLIGNLNIYVEQKSSLEAEKRALEDKLLSYRPFRFLNEAYVQDSPVAPRKLFNLAIAGVLGGFIALFFVLMKNYLLEDRGGIKEG